MEVVTHKAFLLRACTDAPREELTGWAADEEALVWGPRGTFAHRANGGWVVRADGKVAGKLPESAVTPVFRP